MDLQLKGKRVVVSGSTADIGYAIAAALAREGARVVVNGRTAARVDAAVARIRAEHAGATVEGVVLSGVRLSRHYLPGMVARKWGRVVFISSESAEVVARRVSGLDRGV